MLDNIICIFAGMAGIYIHFPFCKRRCAYCDFYSTTEKDHGPFVEAVAQELAERANYLQGESIKTIYFGGGTPSQFSLEELKRFIEELSHYPGVSLSDQISVQEFTMECNPDDLTEAYVQELTTLPINRLSIGVQSFQDDLLHFISRRHNAQQAIDAVNRCKRYGFNNISIDLIYGLPGSTEETWRADVQQAIALDPTHISAYHLIYEEGTPLQKRLAQGEITEAKEEDSILYFHVLRDELFKAGFEAYEISNFCKPGYESKHNSSYWRGIPYLGIGPSAHSYDGKDRQWNAPNLHSYCDQTSRIKGITKEIISPEMHYNEILLTRLRTKWGIDLVKLNEQLGSKYMTYIQKQAQKYITSGDMLWDEVNQNLRISPKGLFISDGIISDLMSLEED